MFHAQCGDFVKVEDSDLWLPRRCDITSSAYELRPNHVAERPVYVTLLRVGTVARTEFEDEEFRLWYDMGGSMVSDHTHEKAPEGDAFVYTVPASDEELARLAGNRGNTRWWLVVANVGVAVVLIVGIALKRRRQKQ